jgi:hypothetical protein
MEQKRRLFAFREEENSMEECATEARFRLLPEGNTTGVEVVKAATYLAPKGGRGQQHVVREGRTG